jgi:hypothetical protein
VTLNASLELARSASFFSSSSFPSLCCFDLSLRACVRVLAHCGVAQERRSSTTRHVLRTQKQLLETKEITFTLYWWKTKLRKGFLTLMERVGWGFQSITIIGINKCHFRQGSKD